MEFIGVLGLFNLTDENILVPYEVETAINNLSYRHEIGYGTGQAQEPPSFRVRPGVFPASEWAFEGWLHATFGRRLKLGDIREKSFPENFEFSIGGG